MGASTVHRVEALSATPHVSAFLMVSELVICVVSIPCSDGAQESVLCAWHVPTGARLPRPWHSAGPLDIQAGTGATPSFLPVPRRREVRLLVSDPALRWVLTGLADATGPPLTAITAF